MSVTLATPEKGLCGLATIVGRAIKTLEAEVEMKEIQLNESRKRYVKALTNLEIMTDGLLWLHSAKWLAQEYGVPPDRINNLRKRIKRG